MAQISVIIVNWNTKKALEECLYSIFAGKHGIDFEVIVVDNASTDGSPEMVKKLFPEVVLIESHTNLGFAGGNNLGIKNSCGKFVLLLNSDTIVPPYSFDRLVDKLRSAPRVGILGCDLRKRDGSREFYSGHFPTLWSEFCTVLSGVPFAGYLFRQRFNRDYEQELDWVKGACMLVRSEVFADIGLLDDGFFMFSEEVDLCKRAKAKGWKVLYTPDVQVIHQQGESTKQWGSCWEMVAVEQSKLRYFEKHYGHFYADMYRRLAIVRALLRVAKLRFQQWVSPHSATELSMRIEQLSSMITALRK